MTAFPFRIPKSVLPFLFLGASLHSVAQTAGNTVADSAKRGLGPNSDSLLRHTLFLDPVEVTALRAGDRAPFTKLNITAATIAKGNTGQDLPFLLNQTPSVVVNSDAGNGVGYTGISIRGTDATRINMTLNGLPYNDAESQSIYFVDLPDFASSVGSIQVQRGIGTSSNGAGAFGATMNFSTNTYHPDAYAELDNTAGSFNTWKNTVRAGSGLLGGHFTLDMRLSRISSDGFVDRASSDLKSAYFSAAWFDASSSIRFNYLTGSEKTYQSWNGVPESKLSGDREALDAHYARNSDYAGALYNSPGDSLNLYRSDPRRYNYFTYANQTDNYRQDHYQLFFNHRFSSFLSANIAAFLTRGKGYYEEYKTAAAYSDYGLPDHTIGDTSLASTDLVRQKWLDNFFYGGIFSLQYKKNQTSVTAGGGWDRYDGKHYDDITWAAQGGIPGMGNYRYFNAPARKTDANSYVKWEQQLTGNLSSFIDLQYRHIYYRIEGFDDNPSLKVKTQYDFFNPKAGLSWHNGPWEAYLSYARAAHEPNRDDFEAGADQQPKAEKLQDTEAGFSRHDPRYHWGITGYYMRYRDQLVLTGKINDIGAYTRTNTPESYRLGVELEGEIKPVKWFYFSGNLTVSRNKALHYTEYTDDYDNGGQKTATYAATDLALSPDVTAAVTPGFFPLPALEISLPGKYVGKSYLDNAQDNAKKLSGYYVQQLRLIYTVKKSPFRELNLTFQLNNCFDKKYEANGYTYSYYSGGVLVNENFLFPQAGRNFLAAVHIGL